MRFLLSVSVVILGLIFVLPVSAQNDPSDLIGVQEVLGTSTDTSQVEFPPVTGGPGFILPDSLLYPLDKVVQRLRLAVAFTSEQKARAHMQIADERLSELRIMMNRKNAMAIESTLTDLTREVDLASNALSEGAAKGKDTQSLAKDLNDTIKLRREILAKVSSQLDPELSSRFDAANASLLASKIDVERHMAEQPREEELAYNLSDVAKQEVLAATTSTMRFEKSIMMLEKYASRAATRRIKQFEERIKDAEEKGDEDAKERLEKALEKFQEQLKLMQERRAKAIQKAREAALRAKEAREEYQAAKPQTAEFETDL